MTSVDHVVFLSTREVFGGAEVATDTGVLGTGGGRSLSKCRDLAGRFRLGLLDDIGWAAVDLQETSVSVGGGTHGNAVKLESVLNLGVSILGRMATLWHDRLIQFFIQDGVVRNPNVDNTDGNVFHTVCNVRPVVSPINVFILEAISLSSFSLVVLSEDASHILCERVHNCECNGSPVLGGDDNRNCGVKGGTNRLQEFNILWAVTNWKWFLARSGAWPDTWRRGWLRTHRRRLSQC
jgi:hypothetical protein